MWYDPLLYRGLVPDALIRRRIRELLEKRLADEKAGDPVAALERHSALVKKLRESPVAIAAAEANAQHYEVPPAFFQLVLGRYLKYSCALWAPGVTTLDGAEESMLKLTCERAKLVDGQNVLELGCGWGSLTLYAAKRFPGSRIVAVTGSASQRAYVEAEAARRGLGNLKVVTCDMSSFDPATGPEFDRVVSVEMFEHMRNYQELLARVGSWMRPDGRLFVHLFSHRDVAYPYEVKDETDWMAKTFFTGGLMPSDHLLLHFQENVVLEERWRVGGAHYRQTAEAWLRNLDRNRRAARELLATAYGKEKARRKLIEWRLFFLACAELFGYRGGTEWMVSHYRFRRR